MSVSKVFVARLVGLAVLGPDGESIGRVRDVVISIRLSGLPPRVLGLAVELTTRRRIFVPILRVTAIDPHKVTLSTGTVSLRRMHLRPGEALAVGQVLDTSVRVTDPDLAQLHDEDLTVVDLGIERGRTRDWLVTRVAVRANRLRLGRRGEIHVVEWGHVRGLTQTSLNLPGQAVAAVLLQLDGMRAADAANVLRELPPKRREEIAAALHTERLADILEELPSDDAQSLIAVMGTGRARRRSAADPSRGSRAGADQERQTHCVGQGDRRADHLFVGRGDTGRAYELPVSGWVRRCPRAERGGAVHAGQGGRAGRAQGRRGPGLTGRRPCIRHAARAGAHRRNKFSVTVSQSR